MKIKNLLSFLKSKLTSKTGKNKTFYFLGIILLILICLCIFVFPKNKSSEEKNESKIESTKTNSLKYEDVIEGKILNMLLAIGEINQAKVMVVCDSSEHIEYLKNRTETSSGSGESASKTITEEVVYEKNGSNSSAVIISKTMPKILGVWIVVNEISPSTKLAITNSICSVLNISESSISILQER